MTVVSSWGCLALSGERRLGRLITGHEGSPPRSAPNLAHRRNQGALLLISLACQPERHVVALQPGRWPR
ncbi:MAG: hypothetical protein EA346_01085 [Thioalkalivibrio sp.]|nr:MAG: hypothetical protein EA346_01085 [Thioalkalivibrio sp.]